jgi:ABC-2 type transport system permease protein
MTQLITSIYKPTFLQKLLGRNYKWWYLFLYQFKRIFKFKTTVFGYRIGEVLQALAVILLWQTTFISKDESEIKNIVTYFVLGSIIQIITRAYLDNSLPNMIASGGLVKLQMLPQSLFGLIITRGFGGSAATNFLSLTTVPFFIIPFAKYLLEFQGNFWSIMVIVSLIIFSLLIKYFYQIIASSVAFWTPEYSGVISSASVVANVFSGALIPFYILNSNFDFLKFNPFAFTFYHPMQIYLGKYTKLEIFYVFLGGLAWCIALYLLAKWVFKLGLKRNEAVGL